MIHFIKNYELLSSILWTMIILKYVFCCWFNFISWWFLIFFAHGSSFSLSFIHLFTRSLWCFSLMVHLFGLVIIMSFFLDDSYFHFITIVFFFSCFIFCIVIDSSLLFLMIHLLCLNSEDIVLRHLVVISCLSKYIVIHAQQHWWKVTGYFANGYSWIKKILYWLLYTL